MVAVGKCLLPVLFLISFLAVKATRKVEMLMHDFSSVQSVITQKLA